MMFGPVGAIFMVIWALAGFMIPFFVWGIHSKVSRMARDFTDIKQLLKKIADGDAVEPADDGLLRDM
jgi:hypothetical protein